MRYLNDIITKKTSQKIKDSFILEGVNGSGKTTKLREIINRNSNMTTFKKNPIDRNLSKKKELEIYSWTNENIFRSTAMQSYALELYYFTGLDRIHNIIECYSSGQKKKLTFILLLVGNNYLWYIDEPQNYLDNLAYCLFKSKLKRHLNMGGKVILTNNSSISIINEIKKKISLSRFELLTTRLSSECSTTEL